MVQGHRRTHGQVAGREIDDALACQPQLEQQGFGQAVHQRAVAGQAHNKKAPGTIAACHQLSHPVGQHLVAEFTVLPEGQPLGRDLHGLLEGGLARSWGHRYGHKLHTKAACGR